MRRLDDKWRVEELRELVGFERYFGKPARWAAGSEGDPVISRDRDDRRIELVCGAQAVGELADQFIDEAVLE